MRSDRKLGHPAVELRNRGFNPKTNGDEGYSTAEVVTGMRELGVVPHPALKARWITPRIVCTAAYAASWKVRTLI